MNDTQLQAYIQQYMREGGDVNSVLECTKKALQREARDGAVVLTRLVCWKLDNCKAAIDEVLSD